MPDGQDSIVVAIASTGPRIASVLHGIRARSPNARIIVVGYPTMFPVDGSSCFPIVTSRADDLRYFEGLVVRLNAMLAQQAAANGSEFADTYAASLGHDACAAPGTKWLEGFMPTSVAFPLHLNALGMQSMARTILRVVRAPPVLSNLTRASRSLRLGRAARLRYRLNRVATVGFVLERATRGHRQGRECERTAAGYRGRIRCGRYVRVAELAGPGARGNNDLAIPAAVYADAGLFRVTAIATNDNVAGKPQVVYFRVRHAGSAS